MKKLLPILAFTLLLVACGEKTVSFTVTMDTQDPKLRSDLMAAIPRVVDGRVEAKKKHVVVQSLEEKDGALVLTATVSDAEAAELLKNGLTAPYSMAIMKKVDAGMGDMISEKFGDFKETGISTKHFAWVVAGVTSSTGEERGMAVIQLTPDGQSLLKDMFSTNRGSTIGIFARGQLMSIKTVDTTDKQDSIAVDGIPNGALAAAFADDANVGLHVTFTSQP
ncbi:hypothetical protein EXS70_02630 [Candidatus Peribacteria bacterium]|nr:hypothetical protein [Candidatus Peribacteria bacterium]